MRSGSQYWSLWTDEGILFDPGVAKSYHTHHYSLIRGRSGMSEDRADKDDHFIDDDGVEGDEGLFGSGSEDGVSE